MALSSRILQGKDIALPEPYVVLSEKSKEQQTALTTTANKTKVEQSKEEKTAPPFKPNEISAAAEEAVKEIIEEDKKEQPKEEVKSERQKLKNEKEESKEEKESVSLETWDSITNARIAKLHLKVQIPAIKFINQVAWDLKIKLRVTEGLRTFDEQDALYAQGRTAPGKIVTNAKGGQSYHNYGLALDVVEIKDNKTTWDTNWPRISEIGINHGFEWGGNFKGFSDKPHFQMTFGYSISELLKLYSEGKWK